LASGYDAVSVAEPTWDSIADWYAELVASGSPPQRLALDAILELLPPLEGLTILDLGCGEGLAARALAALGARVTGIDSYGRLLERDTPPGTCMDRVPGRRRPDVRISTSLRRWPVSR
jgi:SAM-dependent methyltransferase